MSTTTNPKHKCLLITHDAVNFSPTKQKFSFSRDQRFKSISGTTPTPSEFTVNLPATFGRRSPSFGIGERFKSRTKNEIPPPGNYKVLSSFDMDNRATMPKTNYYSFGLSASREQVNKVYNPMENSPRQKDVRDMPGPGEYKYKNFSVGQEGRHFSFLKRTKNAQEPENIMIKNAIPGPGTYGPQLSINKIGKYVLSTVPNSRAANWSPSKTRFYDSTKSTRNQPGPGAYNPSDIDSTNGSYLVSNFRNTGNVKFIKPKELATLRSRTPMNRGMTPGPGSYMLPSDFGYLEARNSPRNMISTQGSVRPRLVSRLQLSTMTGNISHNLGEISINGTERDKSATVKSQSVKKRKQMNNTFMRQRTGGIDDLCQDSLDQQNQLTTRE